MDRLWQSVHSSWNLLLILTVSCVVLARKFERCPAKENMVPCTCKSDIFNGLIMHCSSLSNDSEIARVVTLLKDQKFFQVIIKDSNLGNIRPDLFYGLQTHSIEFSFSRITNLGEINRPPFLGLEQSLVSLTVEEGFKEKPLTRLSLSHLKQLSYLLLRSNLIPSVPNDWFESGPYQLQYLYFQDSSVESLGSHAFASLSQLKRLWITGSKITEITRSMLPKKAGSLMELDFSYNQIQSLPEDIFTSMPTLQMLNLRSNGLTTISKAVFGSIWSGLTTVRMGDNPLYCDKKLKWLYNYRFPVVFEASCSSPKKLTGKSLRRLKTKDLK